jgi:hypothetical protein
MDFILHHTTPALMAVILIYCVAAYLLFRRHMSPFARKLFVALTIVEIILAGLHTLTWQELPSFWTWFLDLDTEHTLGTLFSAVLFLAVALVTFVNGLRADVSRTWQRVYWWLLAGAFLFASIDEFYTLHDGSQARLNLLGVAGVALIGVSLAAYRIGFQEETGLFVLFFSGLGILGSVAVAAERIIWDVLCFSQIAVICHKFMLLEEFFEMAGTTLVLAGVTSYAQTRLVDGGWRLAKRVTAAGSVLWLIWLVVGFWFLPTAQAHFLAEPVQVDYLDGTLSLVGYRVKPQVAAPGDRLRVTLYWRANEFLPLKDYGLSAHVLTHPDATSVAQTDVPLLFFYPANAWLPGLVVRQVVTIDLPDDLATPRSYWLMVRPWHKRVEIPVSRTDRLQIGPDTVILGSLPALSGDPLPQPQTRTGYHFDAGFTLYGCSLPHSAVRGEALPLAFWWRAETDVDRDLTQFVHLIRADGEGFYGHDRQPFDGAFPTLDWPEGAEMMDEWLFPLPEDMPEGAYRVYVGMYEWPSLERQPVTGEDGQPVTDSAILLGTVVILPQE